MDPKVRARNHIKEFARDRKPEEDNRNIRDLKKAVEYLADKLYRSQTHFLLELIQNAEDNKYSEGKVPSLSLEYGGQSLRIDCNEDGFTEADVEAICSVGNSTKSRSARERKYIGEKGIGFKSVFKVATRVWISSGNYSFMFDRTRPLGMITPIWEDFPGPSPNIGTSMHLQLSDDCDKQQLRNEIRSFDANTLLFLTTLREVNLIVHTSDQTAESRLHREDRRLDTDTKSTEVKIFKNNKKILHYLIFWYSVRNMPNEPRRPNSSKSDILLAFPVINSPEDRLRSHQVYAFLPIRDCGFKFLIQADFLLVAGREDIDGSCPWNRKLVNSIPDAFATIPDAFASAAEYLNSSSLRYTWPQYIPRRHELQADFRDLSDSIVKKLSDRCVLESEGGQMSAPLSLTYIPKEFTLKNGEPLSLNGGTRSTYLSRKYSLGDKEELELLRVKALDFPGFVSDLKESLREQAGKDRSQQWHSALAKVLVKGMVSPVDDQELRQLQIIPLRDGRWVAAKECGGVLFFPTDETRISIPEWMRIMEIHPDALGDPFRAQLFQSFGAKPFSIPDICEAIFDMTVSSADSLPTKTLISQAVFLFRHSRRCADRVDLWVATDTGKRYRASEVYLSAFEAGGRRFPALHRDYLGAVPEEPEKWRQWLNQELRICTVPRLVTPMADVFHLSDEMDLIRTRWPSAHFLKLLRDNWTTYSEWLDSKNRRQRSQPWITSHDKLRRRLENTPVKCRGKPGSCPLHKTILPSVFPEGREKIAKYLQVLDIPEPEDRGWSFLENLGVIVNPSVTLYLQALKAAQGKEPTEDYAWLYAKIQDSGPKDMAAVKQAFSQNPLVFIPRSTSGESRYLKTDRCIWSGPRFLKRTPILDKLYPSCQRLFQVILGVRDADIQTIITETLAITASDDLGYIVSLFSCLDNYADRDGSNLITENVGSFQTNDVFPIEPKGSGKNSTAYDHCSYASDSAWYIADRPHLRDGFRGKVPLLAFGNDQLEKMKWIFQLPGIEKRLLSDVAVCKLRPGLQATLDYHFTTLLRTRAKHIARLIPGSAAERRKALNQLESVEVYSANVISVEWDVRGPSGVVATSLPDVSSGVAFPEGKGLRVYLNDGDINAGNAPLEVAGALSAWYNIHERYGLCGALSWNEVSVEDKLAREGIPTLAKMSQHDDFDTLDTAPESPQDHLDCPPATEPSYAAISTILSSITALSRNMYRGTHSVRSNTRTIVILTILICIYMLIRQTYPDIHFPSFRTDGVVFPRVPIPTNFPPTTRPLSTVVQAIVMPRTLPPSTLAWGNVLSRVLMLTNTTPPPSTRPLSTAIPRTPPPTTLIPDTALLRTPLTNTPVLGNLPQTILILTIVILIIVLGVMSYGSFDDREHQVETDDGINVTNALPLRRDGVHQAEEISAREIRMIHEMDSIENDFPPLNRKANAEIESERGSSLISSLDIESPANAAKSAAAYLTSKADNAILDAFSANSPTATRTTCSSLTSSSSTIATTAMSTTTSETILPPSPIGVPPTGSSQFTSGPVTGIVPGKTADIQSTVDTRLPEEPTSSVTDQSPANQDSTSIVDARPPRDDGEHWQAKPLENLQSATTSQAEQSIMHDGQGRVEEVNLHEGSDDDTKNSNTTIPSSLQQITRDGQVNSEELQRQATFSKVQESKIHLAESDQLGGGRAQSDRSQEDPKENEQGHRGELAPQVSAQNTDSTAGTDEKDAAETEPISGEGRGIEGNGPEYPKDVKSAEVEVPGSQVSTGDAKSRVAQSPEKPENRDGKDKQVSMMDDDGDGAMDPLVSAPEESGSDGGQTDPGQKVEGQTKASDGHSEGRQVVSADKKSKEHDSRNSSVPKIVVDEADAGKSGLGTTRDSAAEPWNQTRRDANRNRPDIQTTEDHRSTSLSDEELTIPPIIDRGRKLRDESKDDNDLVTHRQRRAGNLSVGPLEVRSHSISVRAGEVPLTDRANQWAIFPRDDQTEASEFLDFFMSRRPEDSFMNTSRGVILNLSPSTMFLGEDTQETRFFGELYVSQLLSSFLGKDSYRPDEHWTSSMRSRNGHKPFDEKTEDSTHSTFTISETRGKLRDSVIRAYQMLDSALNETCKFHIQVCTTNRDLCWPFILSNAQYDKAKGMTLGGKTRPGNVYILARVYNVRTKPGIALYADPWRLHQEGSISLESASSYRGSISPLAFAMLVERPTEATTPSETEKIYKGLEINSDQIRLLKLDVDGEEDSPLKGKLIVTSIKQGKPSDDFWAISYVWGPKPTKLSPFRFVVNDVEIPITESLWTCLSRLRRDGVTNLIWADAVCINQKDNVEKSMQVRRMGSLYSKAKRVIIWMGGKEDDDRDAIGLLDEFCKQRRSRGPGHKVQVPFSDRERDQISAFLQRPWFTRTWIIQELVFGSHVTVMYENSEIEWDDFMEGVMAYEEQLRLYGGADRERFVTHSDPVLALHHTRQTLEGRSEESGGGRLKFPFLRLIEMFFYTKSSKPRDKLFALLNMAADTNSDEEAFIPDYESDDAVILSRYAEEFVKRDKALELLYRAGREKGSKFSSWIPDLTNHDRRPHYGPTISTWRAVGTRYQAGFSAGASLSPNAVVSNPGLTPVLTITGKMFDSIQSCRSLHSGPSAEVIHFSDTLEVLRQHLSVLKYYPNLGKHWRDDVLVKTLIGDALGPQRETPRPFSEKNREEVPKEWPQGFEKEVLALRPGQDAREHVSKPDEVQQRIDQFWQTAAAFLGRIPNAAACLTMRGYAGVVPGKTQPKDEIFLVHGASVPFVLREIPGTKYYELRGECYVHRVMYHEEEAVGNLKDKAVSLV